MNCLDSLDKDDINLLRESLRLSFVRDPFKKPEENIEEILEDPEIKEEFIEKEIKEEFLEKDTKENFNEIPEDIVPFKPNNEDFVMKSNAKTIKVIKARPISANLKNLNKEIEIKGLNKLNSEAVFSKISEIHEEKSLNINTNPFKSFNRPKTELSSRKTVETKGKSEFYTKNKINLEVSMMNVRFIRISYIKLIFYIGITIEKQRNGEFIA